MKKSELKSLIREVIKESTMKYFEVFLDRPGRAWSTVVRASSPNAAKSNVREKYGYYDTNIEVRPATPEQIKKITHPEKRKEEPISDKVRQCAQELGILGVPVALSVLAKYIN